MNLHLTPCLIVLVVFTLYPLHLTHWLIWFVISNFLVVSVLLISCYDKAFDQPLRNLLNRPLPPRHW